MKGNAISSKILNESAISWFVRPNNISFKYTLKVAITTHRIKEITNTTISFCYKDYQDGNKQKLMTLRHEGFLRRFEQHFLPRGFVKIRHKIYTTPYLIS